MDIVNTGFKSTPNKDFKWGLNHVAQVSSPGEGALPWIKNKRERKSSVNNGQLSLQTPLQSRGEIKLASGKYIDPSRKLWCILWHLLRRTIKTFKELLYCFPGRKFIWRNHSYTWSILSVPLILPSLMNQPFPRVYTRDLALIWHQAHHKWPVHEACSLG